MRPGGQSAAWETLFDELSHPGTAGLETLAEETPNAPPGHWAPLEAAERHLAQGSRLLFENKENATQELRKAVAGYTTAIESSGTAEQELLEQAYFGRARAYEALAGADLGNWEEMPKAIANYNELLTRWPKGPYSAAAKRQLDVLGTTQGKQFYQRFAAYRPKPLAARQPGKLPSLDELRKAIPDDAEFAKQPLLQDILKQPEATSAKPGAGTPAPKPGAETPTPGKAQPPAPEPPTTILPTVPGPAKPEPAKSEPPKPPPAAEPAKPAPAEPEAPKSEPAKPEPAKKS